MGQRQPLRELSEGASLCNTCAGEDQILLLQAKLGKASSAGPVTPAGAAGPGGVRDGLPGWMEAQEASSGPAQTSQPPGAKDASVAATPTPPLPQWAALSGVDDGGEGETEACSGQQSPPPLSPQQPGPSGHRGPRESAGPEAAAEEPRKGARASTGPPSIRARRVRRAGKGGAGRPSGAQPT